MQAEAVSYHLEYYIQQKAAHRIALQSLLPGALQSGELRHIPHALNVDVTSQ